ncbi:nicotinamide-nucleotide amidohydrolase family protein [Bifidobacterium sp. 64T4]|uniref:CinA family protein n=1 Tax=Bifidobacterium pongonis TaxID=2834432 RepID=UPI001C576E0E|nr:nicotinamide-nucleotide amidohydrolase family protein [Bifidobacterium pongonis]MBW3095233.1 nicotinamide-nucleotide amidohydrolase family protein [Bifidobacterium pongonis]
MSESDESLIRRGLAADLLHGLEPRGVKLACAESLTGGLLADALVRIPGASAVFLGSAVTYDIRAKASILGVDRALLEREGAVHPEVARQMAAYTAHLYDQPEYEGRVIGLSTTGVAGPGPDGDKPAGLAYVAVAVPDAMAHAVRDHLAGGLPDHTMMVGEGPEALQGMGNGWHAVAYELRLDGSREQVRESVVTHVLRIVTQLTLSIVE